MQIETTSRANALALAEREDMLAVESLAHCVAMNFINSKTFLVPFVHGVFRLAVDTEYRKPVTWLSEIVRH